MSLLAKRTEFIHHSKVRAREIWGKVVPWFLCNVGEMIKFWAEARYILHAVPCNIQVGRMELLSIVEGGLPLITYAPRGRGGGGQASYTFLLRITCKRVGGAPESM